MERPDTTITSHANPRVRHLRQLIRMRKARDTHREFFVEGVQAVWFALDTGWDVRQIIFAPSLLRSDAAANLLERVPAEKHLRVSAAILKKLSGRDNPGEIAAVIGQPDEDPRRIPLSENLVVIALEKPRDPGNLGTIIRSADAFGADGVLIIGDAVDTYNPHTVRATMGSLFAIPAVRLPHAEAFAEWSASIREAMPDVSLVGTEPRAPRPVESFDFSGPVVLLFGNEQKGLSEPLRDLCDVRLTIPMTGSAESLNTGVAASIVLYEAMRQRRAVSSSG